LTWQWMIYCARQSHPSSVLFQQASLYASFGALSACAGPPCLCSACLYPPSDASKPQPLATKPLLRSTMTDAEVMRRALKSCRSWDNCGLYASHLLKPAYSLCIHTYSLPSFSQHSAIQQTAVPNKVIASSLVLSRNTKTHPFGHPKFHEPWNTHH
jgi:hypothetical protein